VLSPDRQYLAVVQVGETTDPPGLLAANVAALAAAYDGLDAALPAGLPGVSLEDAYVQRDLAQIALGVARARVQTHTSDGFTAAWQQEAERLAAVIFSLTREIVRIETMARASLRTAVGQLATTAPVAPPWPGGLDANDPRLRGSPYYPLTRRGPW